MDFRDRKKYWKISRTVFKVAMKMFLRMRQAATSFWAMDAYRGLAIFYTKRLEA